MKHSFSVIVYSQEDVHKVLEYISDNFVTIHGDAVAFNDGTYEVIVKSEQELPEQSIFSLGFQIGKLVKYTLCQ